VRSTGYAAPRVGTAALPVLDDTPTLIFIHLSPLQAACTSYTFLASSAYPRVCGMYTLQRSLLPLDTTHFLSLFHSFFFLCRHA
jgi:hypothetical protein